MTRLISLIAVLTLLAACGSAAAGPPAGGSAPAASGAATAASAARALPPELAALVDAARREGRVVVYGVNSTPADEEVLQRAFADFYGFSLDLSFETGLHPQKVAELVNLGRSGVRSGIDLFWSSDLMTNQLDQAGLLRDASWVAPLGLSSDATMLHGQSVWIHDSFLVNVLYNSQKVTAQEAPHRYQDLLQPRWQGAIVGPRTPSQMVYLTYIYGEDAATELAEGLVRQRLAFVPTYPDATGRVAAGEYLLGIGQHAERENRKGAPLADAPLDIGIVIPWGMVLLADAEHPAAATLLAYFLGSPEGQRTIDQTWAISRTTAPDTALWRLAQGKELKSIPLDWLEREQTRLQRKYADILGIR
jgi:iron(III) transport system substrate-binding protein